MKNIAAVIALVIGFIAVRYGLDTYRVNKTASAVEQQITQLENDSVQKLPNMPKSFAMQKEATQKIDEKLSNEADKKQLETAAGVFMGFYLVNTRSRVEFCNNLGVDVQQFKTAFESKNAVLLAKAQVVISKLNATEDKLFDMLKPQLAKMIAQDMQDVAASAKTDNKGACELIANNADMLVEQMQLSKLQPKAYQILSAN